MSIIQHVQSISDGSSAMAQLALSWWAEEPTPTAPVPAPTVNTEGIRTFIITKVVPILLAAIGVVFISRAGKGEMSKVLTSSAIVFIGIAFVVGGIALLAFGRALTALILPTPAPSP